MKKRVISGVIMLPLLLIAYFGGVALLIGSFIVGVLGVREFFNGFRKIGINPSFLIAFLSAVGLYVINIVKVNSDWYMLWFFCVVTASFLYLFNTGKRRLEDGAATITGIFYVVFFSYHLALTGQIENYPVMVWLIILSAFGTDVMAYFTGVTIGRHKLCPGISPKKTVEGAIGGFLGSIILCGVCGYYLAGEILLHCLIIGALGGVVSQLGDLTASVFKRKMDIKDYGNLIPGHGGVLDRFDSLLFTAPMVYYYVSIVLV
jgi:phosphatidate cytidylyltransferase